MANLLRPRGRATLALALATILLVALAAPAAAKHPPRPFLGRTTGVDVILPPTPDCPAGSMFYVEDRGTANFTHLGSTSCVVHHCAFLDFATGEGWTTARGFMTATAANGDQLTLTYEMAFRTTVPVPTTALARLDWVVTGGTGRFAAATGSGVTSLTIEFLPDLSGATSSSRWWGTISY